MATPTIADLYSFYDIITGENTTTEEVIVEILMSRANIQKESAYRGILTGTKGGDKEKRLSCQFIARFSKNFDKLKEESFNCILDLCDDDDSNIRKQAVHDLLQFCKRIPLFIPRVADILVQMFQSEDSSVCFLFSRNSFRNYIWSHYHCRSFSTWIPKRLWLGYSIKC